MNLLHNYKHSIFFYNVLWNCYGYNTCTPPCVWDPFSGPIQIFWDFKIVRNIFWKVLVKKSVPSNIDKLLEPYVIFLVRTIRHKKKERMNQTLISGWTDFVTETLLKKFEQIFLNLNKNLNNSNHLYGTEIISHCTQKCYTHNSSQFTPRAVRMHGLDSGGGRAVKI